MVRTKIVFCPTRRSSMNLTTKRIDDRRWNRWVDGKRVTIKPVWQWLLENEA